MDTNPSYQMSPEMALYLQKLQEQKNRMLSPDYMAREDDRGDQGAFSAPSGIAAMGQAFSQLGTIGGRSSDAGALQANAAALNQQAAQDKKMDLARQDARDKQTGLQMSVLQHLNDKYMAAQMDKQKRDEQNALFAQKTKEDRDFKAEQAQKDRDFRMDLAQQNQDFKKDMMGANGASAFKQLPEESQVEIKDKSSSISKKSSAVNLIDEQLANMGKAIESGDEAQAVAAGEQMLKILNSDVGADAVGAEESKRLGSFLRYKIGNFTSPGSFLGRDLDQFYEQAAGKSNAIKRAINLDKQRISDIYSGKYNQQLTQIPEKSPVFGSKKIESGTAQAATKKAWNVGDIYTDKNGARWRFNGTDFEEQ